ncbi:hypothetical protein V2I01_42535 [Micromonospora sp. BRA006-A]|nr:hypothetical protein [Micromonospora sp. BRA006-A]
MFMAKVVDVAGLYLNPPAGVVALVVHETARIPPGPPTAPGRPAPDRPRAGAAGLFASRTVADGATAGRRYRAADLKRFLTRVDASVPAELDVHLIWDNHGAHHTPAVTSWLDRHPASARTSPRPTRPGSPSSTAGSASSPSRWSPAAPRSPCRPWRPASARGSRSGREPRPLHLDEDDRRDHRIPRSI